MKYCKDCQHFRKAPLGFDPRCNRYATVSTTEDVVYGLEIGTKTPTCRDARANGGPCGVEATGFQAQSGEPRQYAPTRSSAVDWSKG